MIEITTGNLLTADAEALVNTVNTEGVMGKGIALQFKQAFPNMFKAYEAACRAGEVQLGRVHIYDLGGLVGGPRWIVNFPTKAHWKSRSKLADVKSGLQDLVYQVQKLGIHSIAVPPLGCGYGGLSWDDVRPLIEEAFNDVPEVAVKLYPPNGAPEPKSMPNHTETPPMTDGRAALIVMMERYLEGLMDPFVSLLEVHKLMYFLQEAGEPLRLKYEAKTYGPYAQNLRQVLIRLDGHYISGYGDGQDNPTKPLELIDDAVEKASQWIENSTQTLDRISRVSDLISGFEDPYGLELLSSMHWVMCADPLARDSVEEAIAAVHKWNARKKSTLKRDHLHKAWARLKDLRWDTESKSAIH
ncbi:type II toxin-antitoxin system antitoxin DNA ADP-ribosyl glycohydrolase DarG [Herbaspirillum aquaticum]|uniref:Appr-1-p processing protein n=1 Tax=Herbaspirillum aquaticum TaxID=568783 RepID=A0A225SSX2_9BURK|nr:macro domain-containing protein [Herbaspirillum aquaticum]OWY33703.1 Appr-1-p processing protein [Herbaspirillum aquaticum]